MKTKIAMLISTAGVVVAGSAAALVNTQVLGSSTTSQPPVFASAPATQPTVSVPTTSTIPTTATLVITPANTGTSNTATSVVSTPPPSAAPSGSQAVYAIGTAGTVTLDTAGDVLTIVSVAANGGWTVTKSANEDSTNVEVRVESGNSKVEFHANLLFGVVTTSVESDAGAVTGTSVDDHGGGSGSNSGRGGGGDD